MDSKIDEALEALKEYKEDLDIMYSNNSIDMDIYREILDEMGIIVSTLIMEMRISHEYRGHTEVLPHGTLPESKIHQ